MTGINKPIVMIVDYPPDKNNWLKMELEKLGYDVTLLTIENSRFYLRNRQSKWRKVLLWLQLFALGWRGARTARRLDGILVAWNFISGVFASLYFNFLNNKHFPIIALNMIALDKSLVNNIVRKFIYSLAFQHDNLQLTVNSLELRDKYLNEYKNLKEHRISVLHDAYGSDYAILSPQTSGGSFVFSGGEAARDWDTLLRVASYCKELPFKVIARRMHWHFSHNLPNNVSVQFDTSEDYFYSTVSKSKLVLLPLKTDVFTVGLIVLIRSILLGKLVIATKNPAVLAYFPDHCHDLLIPVGDAETMAQTLRKYWRDQKLRTAKTAEIQNHIINSFSPEMFAKEIDGIIARSSYTQSSKKTY